MIERVRAILVTPGDTMLTIRRYRPGRPAYSVLPGGHVDPDDSDLETALTREIREEIAGEPEIISCYPSLMVSAGAPLMVSATGCG